MAVGAGKLPRFTKTLNLQIMPGSLKDSIRALNDVNEHLRRLPKQIATSQEDVNKLSGLVLALRLASYEEGKNAGLRTAAWAVNKQLEERE